METKGAHAVNSGPESAWKGTCSPICFQRISAHMHTYIYIYIIGILWWGLRVLDLDLGFGV